MHAKPRAWLMSDIVLLHNPKIAFAPFQAYVSLGNPLFNLTLQQAQLSSPKFWSPLSKQRGGEKKILPYT